MNEWTLILFLPLVSCFAGHEQHKFKVAANGMRFKQQVRLAKRRHTMRMHEARKVGQATFDLTDLDEVTHFDGFENNPQTAALLCHSNSGHERFRTVDKLLAVIPHLTMTDTHRVMEAINNCNWQKHMHALLEEIAEETLTPVEKESLAADCFTACFLARCT